MEAKINSVILKIFHERFNNLGEPCGWRQERRARALDRFAIRLLSHLQRAARQASIFELQVTQVRKRGGEAEPVAVAGVDPGHERLDQILIGFPSQSTTDERAERFIAIDSFRWLNEIQ